MKYSVSASNLFKRQLKKVIKQGHSEEKIHKIVDTLAYGAFLDAHFNVHKLKGEYGGAWELHIKSDLLLIYLKYEDPPHIKLVAIGTHSELFG